MSKSERKTQLVCGVEYLLVAQTGKRCEGCAADNQDLSAIEQTYLCLTLGECLGSVWKPLLRPKAKVTP